jgi:hypothetical protein
MNQKILKYGLIAAVALVWGLIIYRIVDGMGGDDGTPTIKSANVTGAAYVAPADSFMLIADYPDPFIPGVDTPESSLAVATTIAPPVVAPPPVVNNNPPAVKKENSVQYLGMIANPKRKLKVATININGKELLAKEKDKVEGYTVVKITADVIEMRYRGRKVTVVRAQ